MAHRVINLPRGYSLGTQGRRFVFTWVESASVPDGRGGHVHQTAGHRSATNATPESAADAAREHAEQHGS